MAGVRLFADDPIDFADPTPYSGFEFYGHLLVGTIWFGAALWAFAVRKGGKQHIWAGQACIIGVFLTSVTALLMLGKEFIAPLFLNAITASYCVATAWLALKPASRSVRSWEYVLTTVEIGAVATFLAIALPNVISGNVPAIGPSIVMAVPLILLLGDLHFFSRPRDRARLRVQRHLARMVWAFVIVLRAPLVEFETAGFYDLPDPLLVAGPPILGVVMLLYFQRRYGALRPRAGAATA